jgi:hypothetical protein
MAKITRNTTLFGKQSIAEFSKFITPDNLCIEITSNRSKCIDTIKCEYDGKVNACDSSKVSNEAYCALTLYVILERAAKDLGYNLNKVAALKTKGAADFVSKAKKAGLLVDKFATTGCCFYRKSEAPGASGHVGLVTLFDGELLHTIEANMTFIYNGKSYDGIFGRTYTKEQINAQGFQFIHTEYLYGNQQTEMSFELPEKKGRYFTAIPDLTSGEWLTVLLATITLSGGGYYAYKNKLIKL